MTISPTFRDSYYAIWLWGQSNATGQVFIPPNSSPLGLPIASVGYMPVVSPSGSSQAVTGSTLVSLDVTTPTLGPPLYWGTEIQLGKDLVALTLPANVSILKTARNGSSLASWLQATATNWVTLASALPIWKANVIAAAAGKPIVWLMMTNQGEFESTDVSPTGANNWAANLAQLKSDAQGAMGITFQAPIVLRTNANLGNGGSAFAVPQLATVRAQQAIADPSFIDSDDVPLGPDWTHYVTPAAVTTLGSRQALRVIPRNFIAAQQLTVR